MPARKAPRASDRPKKLVIHAADSDTSNAVNVNSSVEWAAATVWNSGRISQCPSASMPATAITALAIASRIGMATPPSPPLPRIGISTRNGTTAMSWNSSTAKASRPCGECISSCSMSCLTTMAVDDSARMPPITSAPCHGTPLNQAMLPAAITDSNTCVPPSPNTARRSVQNWASENSSPIMNSRKTTPISASSSSEWRSGSQCMA